MKKIMNLIVAFISLLLIISSSCTKDFEELNTNPNKPDTAPLDGVLAYSIVDLGNRFTISTEMEYLAGYVGHITKSKNTNVQRYVSASPVGVWYAYYLNTLTNLNRVIADATEETVNYKAAAIIIKAYATQIQVDAYGPVPYFDASRKDEGIHQPKFDSEESIYNDMLEQLSLANTLFDANAKNLGVADLIYAGQNLDLWRKFANSLRLRIAIRMSNIDEAKAKAVISEILNNPTENPIFESNSDNATLLYPGEGNKDPWTGGSHLYITIAKPLLDTLIDLNDPRKFQYVDTNSLGQYIGLQVGEEIATADLSGVQDQFIQNEANGKVFFLTYSEVEFIKAEAYARGLTGTVDAAAANTAYQNAITANLEYYGIPTVDITAYLAQPKVVYGDNLNKIYLQKWISLFHQGWEAWAEMRRTDVPQLPVAVSPNYSGHNRVPFRFAYPQIEKDLNGDNIPASVTQVDEYWGYQIWWDTRTGVQ